MRIKESEFYKPFYLMGYDGEAGAVKLYNKMDVTNLIVMKMIIWRQSRHFNDAAFE